MVTTKSKSKYYISLSRSIREEMEKELLDAKIAARNVLDDLQIEKDKIEQINAKDEAILESIGEGVIAVDNGGKIMIINKVALDMLGRKRKGLIGKVITELLLEDETGNPIPFEKRPTTISLSTGKLTKVVYFFVKKDKSRFPMAITATPIKLNGKIIGLIEIIRDVTKEKEIDKAKTEFVSLASHQLRTPLTAISWYTEMIMNGDVGKVPPDQRKYLNEIYQGNKRMIVLINTLLDVSHIELGTLPINLQLVQLKNTIEDALKELKEKIVRKNIIFNKTYDPKLKMIKADPKLLRMVFDNLFSNAVKYVTDNGKISIDIRAQKQDVLIEVWNNGPSIPLEAQPKIFTKLFRDDLAKQRDPDGTGLGLYITKSILDNSGGKIWFNSDDKKGTTFYVTLPIDGVKK